MSHCPEPETLARYLEGTLSRGARPRVERHLGECDACYYVLRESLLLQAEAEVPAPSWHRRLVASGFAAAMLLLVGALFLPGLREDEEPTTAPPRELLEHALQSPELPGRPTVGRLSLRAPYVPWEGAQRSADAEVDPRFYSLFGTAYQVLDEGARGSDRALLGLAHLVLQHPNPAVHALEEAASGEGSNPRVLSDLAAAHLQLAVTGEAPEALARAYRWASRALEVDPDLPEALFNRAFILERLGLAGQAAEAWERYLQADPSSGWAREARKRLEELRRELETPPRPPPPEELSELGAWGRRYPQAAREHLQRALLPRWGGELLAGDPRHLTSLEEARILAGVVAERQRDPSFEGMLEETRRRVVEGGEPLVADARAHVAFGEGWELLWTRPAVARERFDEAAASWARLDSPWEDWARVWGLHAVYLEGAEPPAEIGRRVAGFLEGVDGGETPLLRGRGLWFQGLLASLDARYDTAIRSYREAFSVFEGADEIGHASFLAFQVADNYGFLGDNPSAWEWSHRSLSFSDLRIHCSRLSTSLIGIGHVATATGYPHIALTLLDEGVSLAGVNPLTHIDGLRHRALLQNELHHFSAAEQDLREARQLLSLIESESVRHRLEAEITLDEAQLAVSSKSRTSPSALAEAERLWSNRTVESRALRLALIGAEASALAGNTKESERQLRLAAELASQDTSQEPERATRVPKRARQVSEHLVELVWQTDAEAALLTAERGRRFGLTTVPDGSFLQELRSTLDPDTAIIYFEVLDKRTISWIIDSQRTQTVEISLTRATLHSRISALERGIRSGRDITQEAARLGADLLGPAVADIEKPITTLVLVPDESLFRIPFALLGDLSDLSLQGNVSVSVAFDLTSLASVSSREWQRYSVAAEALVVADPALDREVFPHLPRLPSALSEAEKVGSLYPNARLLTGEEATVSALKRLAPQFRILHFAGHAVSDSRQPAHSLLPLAPDPEETPLFAHRISQLLLDNTDLVVLSACSSAASSEGSGSLAHSFLEAGVPYVVGTLWPISDGTAAEILVDFHSRLRQGASPEQALQEAQRAYRERQGTAARVEVWAAFQLYRAS